MIIILVLIGFVVLVVAVLYFSYRRAVNYWLSEKKYRGSRNVVIAVVIVVVAVVITLVFVGRTYQGTGVVEEINKPAELENPYTLEIGTSLPPIVLPNLAGAAVDLTVFSDKILLLNFWDTECEFCAQQLETFLALDEETQAKFDIFLVHIGGTTDEIKAYRDEQGIALPILYDAEGIVSSGLQILGTPASFFAYQGTICGKDSGVMTEPEIQEKIEQCTLLMSPGTAVE